MSMHDVGVAIKATAYTASGGLIVGDWLDFLNEYSAAVGAMGVIVTVVTNFIFNCINSWHIRKRGIGLSDE